MFQYIVRRLMLLPITLFFIVLVNFIIVNMAPGDPVTITERSEQGATRRQDRSVAFGSDDRFLQFREFYGLTLPILFNRWPNTSQDTVDEYLWTLIHRKESPESTEELSFKDYDALRVRFGDMSRFIMPKLLHVLEDGHAARETKAMAMRFFVRGATRQAIVGPDLTEEQKLYNRKVDKDNNFLSSLMITPEDDASKVSGKVASARQWYDENKKIYNFDPDFYQKISIFFTETRFFRYMSRVLTLDFGTLRNDSNKTVISEVVKRFKYSLTLSVTPLVITFVLCLLFGSIMALFHNRWPDVSLTTFFLVLYAIPIFVVAPFLIENVALDGYFPFTHTPIPMSGFTSPDAIYDNLNSYQRLFDVFQHIFLPLVAILYGSLAAQSRLARTAVLEVLRQDYVRTAKAKGVAPPSLLIKHVGRNAAITIVTALAGSLGVVLGGSLIVETLFEIDGYGKFFYDAILNRDYNVIMFSALAGAFLSLLGYLAADIAYAMLDPRVTLD